jgi:hypothetical protein
MATKKTPAKPPVKKPASTSAKKPAKTAGTIELAKQLAAAVIREHGLPKEIADQLRKAGVSQEVIDQLGGDYAGGAPHNPHYEEDEGKGKGKGKGKGD